MSLCDRRITNWYRSYNERWFGGELPEDVDVIWAPVVGCCADLNVLFNDPESYILRLNPRHSIDMNACRINLLHEMVHIKLWPRRLHGTPFHKEIQRLAAIGAYKGLL
jgi:hypothetical protein